VRQGAETDVPIRPTTNLNGERKKKDKPESAAGENKTGVAFKRKRQGGQEKRDDRIVPKRIPAKVLVFDKVGAKKEGERGK